MAQMNPLVGPKLNQHTILIMAREWVRFFFDFSQYKFFNCYFYFLQGNKITDLSP